MCFLDGITLAVAHAYDLPKHSPNMGCHNFTLVRSRIHENPLDQIIAILISSNYELLAVTMLD